MRNQFPENDFATKSSPFVLFTKDDIKGERTRAGIYAVCGNRDNVGDRIMPGAFTQTHKLNMKNIVHLWDHGLGEVSMPTAKIEALYEIGKSDLPDAVLETAPDATGAAVVVRTYLDTPVSMHLLKAIDAQAINQMSFAYRIPKGKSEQITETIQGEKMQTRIIREIQQKDTSDVRWGCNGATLAQFKSLLNSQFEFSDEDQFKTFLDFLEDLKAGARNSSVDANRIKQIHDLCKELSADCCGDEEEETPPKNDADDATTFIGLDLLKMQADLESLTA